MAANGNGFPYNKHLAASALAFICHYCSILSFFFSTCVCTPPVYSPTSIFLELVSVSSLYMTLERFLSLFTVRVLRSFPLFYHIQNNRLLSLLLFKSSFFIIIHFLPLAQSSLAFEIARRRTKRSMDWILKNAFGTEAINSALLLIFFLFFIFLLSFDSNEAFPF